MALQTTSIKNLPDFCSQDPADITSGVVSRDAQPPWDVSNQKYYLPTLRLAWNNENDKRGG